MECKTCGTKWYANAKISATHTGEVIAQEVVGMKSEFYDNSKDTLAAIASRYGANVLLEEKLPHYFNDLFPNAPRNIKNIIVGMKVVMAYCS